MRELVQTIRGAGPAGLVLCLMLWLGINTGPWVLAREIHDGMGWLHYARTLLPLVTAGVALLLLMARPSNIGGARENAAVPASLRALGAYALMIAVCSSWSPRPWDALYWAMAYAAVLLVVRLIITSCTRSRAAESVIGLNAWTWLLASLVLVGLLLVSGRRLIVESPTGQTAYGIVARVGEAGGMLMSRASGFARFAAIAAIGCAVLAVLRTGVVRWVSGSVAAGCAVLVYLLQSRGAILGLTAAGLFLLAVSGGRTRLAVALVVLALFVGVMGDVIDAATVENVEAHLLRGQSEEGVRTLTGRTRMWRSAWAILSDSPWLGHGPQADRYLLGGQHVHNAVLYAWLAGGVFGALALVGGFAFGWRDMIRALRSGRDVGDTARGAVLMSAGLLVFFTVRSIPEASGAVFGADLLVLAPALGLLGVCGRTGNARPAGFA